MKMEDAQTPPAPLGPVEPQLGLVERLRQMSRRGHWPLLGDEAADEIERLRGIVPEVLERLNDDLCAENDRLRQALLKCKTCALPTEVRDLVNAALMA